MQKHGWNSYNEQKKQNMKESLQYNSIYMKFKKQKKTVCIV